MRKHIVDVTDHVIRGPQLHKLSFLLTEALHVSLGFVQQFNIAPFHVHR